MNEEQAVLDFFAKPENISLALSVAELIDKQRELINNQFWNRLMNRLSLDISSATLLPWKIQVTEDKNDLNNLVGLHFNLDAPQLLYLRPMIEQQVVGGNTRVYFGLMWSTQPTPEQLQIPEISALKDALIQHNFKSNDNFLGWQWTAFHPRRKEFILSFSLKPEKLLDEVITIFNTLFVNLQNEILAANNALKSAPHSQNISLDNLRRKRDN